MPAPRAHAPFNFVPADDSLGWPINTDDGSGPERYSGSMRIQINALEPLLVCGPQAPNETRRFFKRDGKYTSPGTSLKGMIRNMLEAQSMSTLAPISPRRPFFRDLNNPTYLGRFVEQNGGVSVYSSKAGYLRKGAGGWEILPCEWAKVNQTALKTVGINLQDGHGATPLVRVGQVLTSTQARQGISSPLPPPADHHHPKTWNPNLRLRYRRLDKIQLGGEAKLVVAGFMSGRHFEAVFYPPNSTSKPISTQHAWDDFEDWVDSHKPRGKLLKLLQSKDAKAMYPHGIPVFWIGNGARVEAFGFSQLFCVPYKQSIESLVTAREPEEPISLAESMFGYVEIEVGARRQARRGRVAFGAATCTHQTPPLQAVPVIPGNPAATCLGLYLEQPPARNVVRDNRNHGLTTYDQNKARLRGRKFYWHRRNAWGVLPPNPVKPNADNGVSASYEPLAAGVKFESIVTFTRLSRLELGALLAAVRLPAGHAHKLGLGKPFGLGSVRLDIAALDASTDKTRYASLQRRRDPSPALDVGSFINCFESRIGERCACEFNEIPEIRALRALTSYDQSPDAKLTAYMPLERPDKNDRDSPVYANKPVLPPAVQVAIQRAP